MHTNFSGKAEACINALKSGDDYVYVHIEAADESGHQGSLEDKIKSIELIDSLILEPVYEYLKGCGEEFGILIMPDHPTPLSTRTHSAEPVPFLYYKSSDEVKYPERVFTEKEAEKTGIFEKYAHILTDKILKGLI